MKKSEEKSFVCNACGEIYNGFERPWTCSICGNPDTFEKIFNEDGIDYDDEKYDEYEDY